jgi:hypothetical protein
MHVTKFCQFWIENNQGMPSWVHIRETTRLISRINWTQPRKWRLCLASDTSISITKFTQGKWWIQLCWPKADAEFVAMILHRKHIKSLHGLSIIESVSVEMLVILTYLAHQNAMLFSRIDLVDHIWMRICNIYPCNLSISWKWCRLAGPWRLSLSPVISTQIDQDLIVADHEWFSRSYLEILCFFVYLVSFIHGLEEFICQQSHWSVGKLQSSEDCFHFL